MSQFNDKVVVVTGGNTGIGKSIAEKFNKEGAKIAIFGRNQNKLAEVQKILTQSIAFLVMSATSQIWIIYLKVRRKHLVKLIFWLLMQVLLAGVMSMKLTRNILMK